jgi:hypothetical protein
MLRWYLDSLQQCWLSSNCVAEAVGLGVLGRQQLTRMRIEQLKGFLSVELP